MRLFKLIVTLVIFSLAGIFIYQNLQTLTQSVSFKFNLYFFQINPGESPSLSLYNVILLSALTGFVIGMSLLLRPFFKTRSRLKRELRDKKQVQEELTPKPVGAESQNVADSPSLQADHAIMAEKVE